jgi:glycosyltransferase involved in cell wall biosynthesis
MTSRISVVLPCFNHEAFVGQALRSVFAQGVPDLELVVVDDGSSDGSRAEIQRVLADAGKVRVVYHEQENAGSHAALARGIELASGDVIALLNSDDYFAPTRLARVLERTRPGSDFLVFTGVSFVNAEGGGVAPRSDLPRWYQLALRQSAHCPTVGYALLCNNIAVTSGNLVFSRGLYEQVGGFGNYRFCTDWDFLLRCTRHVEPTFVPDVLHNYRLHQSNTIDAAGSHAVDEEYGRFVSAYLQSCAEQRPANLLAPCRTNWPYYFPYFTRTHRRFNATLIHGLLLDGSLTDHLPEASSGAWQPWSAGVLELHPRDDLGLLAQPDAASPAAGAHEAQALLRELALVRLDMHRRHKAFDPPGTADLELLRDWCRRIGAGEYHPATAPGE